MTLGPVWVECGSGCRETDIYAVLDFLFGVGFRYRHMSNAHLSHHNPGLNLHGLVL